MCLTQGRLSILIQTGAVGHVRLGVLVMSFLVMSFLCRLILSLQLLVLHHCIRHVQALSRMAWLRAVRTLLGWVQLSSCRQSADPVQVGQVLNRLELTQALQILLRQIGEQCAQQCGSNVPRHGHALLGFL